jgi:hypothetical protein
MATHDRPGVPIEEEHEYSSHRAPTPPIWTADRRTAMKRYRPTFPLLRTCLRARSQASPCASDLAARMYEAANFGAGALRHVSRGPAEGTRLPLAP